MKYLYREILGQLIEIYRGQNSKGIILSGVVGCGKTTVIEKLLGELTPEFQIFRYSGDDSQFRQKIIANSRYIEQEIASKTAKKALVFVDEVQKSEEVFDALKIAFDSGRVSFIVSGSNPAYLSTVAKKRLQRRADQLLMIPFTLSELSVDRAWINPEDVDIFKAILWKACSLSEIRLPEVNTPVGIKDLVNQYCALGGLPLVQIAKSEEAKLREIRLTTERGFELMSMGNSSIAEVIRVELARLHSTEFAYKNILNKTRIRQRETVNQVIDDLRNHGYLMKKTPVLLLEGKTSYLSVLSYIDPGIVSYLTGVIQVNDNGSRIEGMVHARLSTLVSNSVYKSELGYFKPHTLDANGNVRYMPGEIDFIFQSGNRLIPIEVKSTASIGDMDLHVLKTFIKSQKIPFGIVLYGGAPAINDKDQIIFWPYWMI